MDEDPMWDPLSSSYEIIMENIVKKINPGGVHEAVAPVFTISVSSVLGLFLKTYILGRIYYNEE